MTPYDEQIGIPSDDARKGPRLWLLVLALLLAVAATLFVYAPFYGLRFEPWMLDGLRYLVLDLRSGFAGMVLALFLLFTVPFLLSSLSGVRRRGRGRERFSESATPGGVSGPVFSSDLSEDQITVPSMALREMGAEARWEMATALGIPWRDELILDHESWEAACHEATEGEAELHR